MPSSRMSRRTLGPLVYLALAGLAFAVDYPGRLNPDSIDQLTQAVHPALLNDWHEPWSIGFWLLFSPVLGEPAGALFAQCLIIFVYPALLVARALASGERAAGSWLALGIFVVALIEVAGQIVKDALLAGFILCFLAALDAGRRKILLGLPPVIAAALIRPVNAFLFGFAAVPALIAFRVRWRIALPALLLIGVLCAVQVGLVKYLDENVLEAADGNAQSSLMIFDVAGISTATHVDLFAAIPDWPSRTLPRPWDCYTPYFWDPFRWGKCGRYFDLFNARLHDPLRFWIKVILSHPGAWLLHRGRHLFQCLKSAAPVATFATEGAVNSVQARPAMFSSFTHGIDMRRQFQVWHPSLASRIAEWIAALVFSRPAGLVEMTACFAAVWAGMRKGRAGIDAVSLAAGGIGLANILVMALFGVAAVGRYFLPAYICGLLILVRALSRRSGHQYL